MNTKTIAIDFDGTICKKQSYGNGEITETPNENASEIIKNLFQEYKIVIFTTRLNPDFGGNIEEKRKEIENWLIKYGIPFDLVTNNKPSAMVYIDDRAIRFTNWQDVSNYLLQ